jgi:hypothetical protein
MRPVLAIPVLLLAVACGPGKLNKKLAEALIKPDYPVVVPVKVPRQAVAEKGSPELARFETINGHLQKSGWFRIERREEGTKIRFEYSPSASAPNAVQVTSKGFDAPAAEAAFVRVLRPEGRGENWKVTYQVRLERPTALFPLFQFLHPQARLGETKERHARIDRQGKNWALMDTDEDFKSRNP